MSQDFTEDAMGFTHQPTEQLGRELADKISRRVQYDTLNAVLANNEDLRSAISAACFWLREGAPGKALEVLDAARERVK